MSLLAPRCSSQVKRVRVCVCLCACVGVSLPVCVCMCGCMVALSWVVKNKQKIIIIAVCKIVYHCNFPPIQRNGHAQLFSASCVAVLQLICLIFSVKRCCPCYTESILRFFPIQSLNFITREEASDQCKRLGAKLPDHEVITETDIRHLLAFVKYIPEWSQSLPQQFRLPTDKCRRGNCLMWQKFMNGNLGIDFLEQDYRVLPVCYSGEYELVCSRFQFQCSWPYF